MTDPWIPGESFERAMYLGFDVVGDFNTGPLVEVSPDLKNVFVRLGRDDIAAH